MQRRLRRFTALLASLASLQAAASAQLTTRVSVDARGIEGNSASSAFAGGGLWGAAITPEGRFVAFESRSSNLVALDGNGLSDVFVHDRQSGVTERISLATSGSEGNGVSGVPALTIDARFVAFESAATNLVPGDLNARRDIFVRDRLSNATERVSVSSAGAEPNNDCFLPSISSDGRYVAFDSAANNLVPGDAGGSRDVFVRDRILGTTALVSVDSSSAQGNANSFDARLALDGRHLAFTSIATNLVLGDGNGMRDIFLRDLALGATELISLDSSGSPADFESDHASISGYGRYVAFQSGATNLVTGDTNGARDVFVRDRQLGLTVRVSVSSSGGQSNFWSYFPSISANGTLIAFDSNASNLVSGDTNGSRDVFVHDRSSGSTTRASVDSAGTQGTNAAALPAISSAGELVVFESASPGLVPGDTNGATDVFVHSLALSCAGMASYCTAKLNSFGCTPVIGASGAALLAGPDAFRITAVNVLSGKAGILLWSQTSAATPFQGGTLCVAAPIKRMGGQLSIDAGLSFACTGTYSFAFDQAYIAAQGLTLGQTLFAQIWSRDSGFAPPQNVGLTNALQLTICQ